MAGLGFEFWYGTFVGAGVTCCAVVVAVTTLRIRRLTREIFAAEAGIAALADRGWRWYTDRVVAQHRARVVRHRARAVTNRLAWLVEVVLARTTAALAGVLPISGVVDDDPYGEDEWQPDRDETRVTGTRGSAGTHGGVPV